MKVSVKELEKTGAGVIRLNKVKSTLTGKIYEANIYRNDRTIKAKVIYYRKGGNRILAITEDNKRESIEEFSEIMNEITEMRRSSRRVNKELLFIKAGLTISYLFTTLNIVNIRKKSDIVYVLADIILIAIIKYIYLIEEKRYEK